MPSERRAKIRGISRFLIYRSKVVPEPDDEPPLLLPPGSSPESFAVGEVVPKNGPWPKRPPRRLRPTFSSDGGAMFSTMATLASEILAATTRQPQLPGVGEAEQRPLREDEVADADDGPQSPPAGFHELFDAFSLPDPPRCAVCRGRLRRGERLESLVRRKVIAKETPQGLPQSEVPGEEVRHGFEASIGGPATPAALERRGGLASEASMESKEQEKEASEGGSIRGFIVVAEVLIFLILLVIGTKNIAVGVSISVLAAIGKRLILALTPCGEADASLDGADEGDVLAPIANQCPEDGSDSISSEQIPTKRSQIC